METYNGHIKTQNDAILLFEACRLGFIPRIRRRLSERERLQIRSGCIYIWEEGEASMKRWTDGKAWSASRVSGSFLTYREMEGNKRATVASLSESRKRKNLEPHGSRQSSESETNSGSDDDYTDVEGCRYKPNGLYKQSFSVTTCTNLKLHLIAYYSKKDVDAGTLVQPSVDPRLKEIRIPKDLYPDIISVSSASPSPSSPLVYAPYPKLPPFARSGHTIDCRRHTGHPHSGSPTHHNNHHHNHNHNNYHHIQNHNNHHHNYNHHHTHHHSHPPHRNKIHLPPPSKSILPPLTQLAESVASLPRLPVKHTNNLTSKSTDLPNNNNDPTPSAKASYTLPPINPSAASSDRSAFDAPLLASATTLPLPKILAEDRRALGMLNRVFL